MSNYAMRNWMFNERVVCAITALSFLGVSNAEVSIRVATSGPYYPELPVVVSVIVSNQTDDVLSANSVGQGSPWVVPCEILREDGARVELCPVSTACWRTGIEIDPGGAMTGRMDVANFVAGAGTTLGHGLPAGTYRIALQYRPWTNRDARITSPPISVTVIEPGQELRAAEAGLLAMRCKATAATNALPVELVSTPRDTDNPYWIASRVHYARWLSRRRRFGEAIPVWEDLLSIRTPAADPFRIDVRLELAQCHMWMKEETKARDLLEPIRDQSDVAYGMLRILAAGH